MFVGIFYRVSGRWRGRFGCSGKVFREVGVVECEG